MRRRRMRWLSMEGDSPSVPERKTLDRCECRPTRPCLSRGKSGGSECRSRAWSGANPLPANSPLMIYAMQLWQEGRPTAVAHRPIIRFQLQTANQPTNKQHNTAAPPAVGDKTQIRAWRGALLIFRNCFKRKFPPWILWNVVYHYSVRLRSYFAKRCCNLHTFPNPECVFDLNLGFETKCQ